MISTNPARCQMSRRGGNVAICETCQWIDVRRLKRDGRLCPGQSFPYSWSSDGDPCGTIKVRIEPSSIVLSFSVRSYDSGECRHVEQCVPVVWTPCHLGGRRPRFLCTVSANGHYCGRRVAKLYLGGISGFACRRCYGLLYASQLEASGYRGLGRARKIREKLGGGPNLLEPIPSKPKGMHQTTYRRWLAAYNIAAHRCGIR
jgi:hypothetical protein